MNHKNSQNAITIEDYHIAIIGLGYVGVPLGYHFAKFGYSVTGFDISKRKLDELRKGIDSTEEIGPKIAEVSINYTDEISEIQTAKIIIIAVPTPVNIDNSPDYGPLVDASISVGKVLQKGQVVVYESTVSPGSTEEVCLPLLEQYSGLKCPEDFTIGYSPERINPGDKEHTVEKIKKVVSGIDDATTDLLVETYGNIIVAGTHRAPDIKTAEASKIIENTQRDVNIAFMNELALYSAKEGIDIYEVLAAAGTKWNFLNFYPGLVGGHCIGVDPYYLADRATKIGYNSRLIRISREINDYMPKHVAQQTIKMLAQAKKNLSESTVLVVGLTFKENVPDFRNSKISDSIKELKEYGVKVKGFDPQSAYLHQHDLEELNLEAAEIETELGLNRYDGVIFAQNHVEFQDLDLHTLLNEKGVVFDVKGKYRGEEFEFYSHL